MRKRMHGAVLAVIGLVAAANAGAQGFAAVVSPPRFELNANAGQTLRQVLELSNRATATQRFMFQTADWTLSPDFSVTFNEQSQPDGCRQWTALERPQAALPAGSTLRYRFEVNVPEHAPAGECRFGILIENEESVLAKSAGLQFPVSGRIGVIVYVVVGDAAPDLELFGPKIVTLNGRRVPTLRIHNGGTAHGRVAGFLAGTDARGIHYDFNPSDFPILPGEVADVYLIPSTPSDENPTLTYPVSVKGTLEWGKRQTEINQIFE